MSSDTNEIRARVMLREIRRELAHQVPLTLESLTSFFEDYEMLTLQTHIIESRLKFESNLKVWSN